MTNLMRNQNLYENFKNDLLLMNQIARTTKISQIQAPANLYELHNILKAKNDKIITNQAEKQKSQTWLKSKGADITPLLQKLRKVKQLNLRKQQLKKQQEQCIFYISDMSYHKIDEYLTKNIEYSMMNITQKIMKKDNLSRKILKRVNKKYYQASSSQGHKRQFGIVTKINNKMRIQGKRQIYVKCISQYAQGGILREDLANAFSRTFNKKFWKIMSRHIRCVQRQNYQVQIPKKRYLFIQSLKLIEQDYDQWLPTTQNLNNYLKTRYLDKLKGDRSQPYLGDFQHLSFWGKLFILYRAGRIKDVLSLLATRNELQMINYIRIAQESIDKGVPVRIDQDIPNSARDVFKQQLIHALRCEPEYSTEVLSDPATIDPVWNLIRAQGICYDQQNSNQFKKIRKYFIQNYEKQADKSAVVLYNLFYLLAYSTLAKQGANEIMDQDDYVHFLICLADSFPLLNNAGDVEEVYKILSKQLLVYIKELISLNRRQYVYYMTLIPYRDRVNEISTILTFSDLIETVDWGYLKKSLSGPQQYQQLVKKTLQKYIATTRDYLTAAQKYIQLLNMQQQAVKCLLQFMIISLSRSSLTQAIIIRAESICDRSLYQRPELQDNYRQTFNFLIECRSLVELLAARNNQQIYKFIKDNKYIVLGDYLPGYLIKLFNNLISLENFGFDTYLRFIKNIIKGLQIYYFKLKNFSQLKQFLDLIECNMKLVFSYQRYSIYKSREEGISLFERFNQIHEELEMNK